MGLGWQLLEIDETDVSQKTQHECAQMLVAAADRPRKLTFNAPPARAALPTKFGRLLFALLLPILLGIAAAYIKDRKQFREKGVFFLGGGGT